MLVACKNLQAYFCVKLWNHSSMCLWSSPLTPFICPLTLLPGTQEGKIREQLQLRPGYTSFQRVQGSTIRRYPTQGGVTIGIDLALTWLFLARERWIVNVKLGLGPPRVEPNTSGRTLTLTASRFNANLSVSYQACLGLIMHSQLVQRSCSFSHRSSTLVHR